MDAHNKQRSRASGKVTMFQHCEDCQYYGNKCHCQYETDNDTQVWYERGFKFGFDEGLRKAQAILTQAITDISDRKDS